MNHAHRLRFAIVSLFALAAAGCGGGGSDGSGMLIQGTLTEAGGASHGRAFVPKHSGGQRIENVEICALGECSTTDGQGQWGFVAPEEFNGGNVLFSVNGHGIATTSIVSIPAGAHEISLDFRHVEGGKIEAHSISVDGAESGEHSHENS